MKIRKDGSTLKQTAYARRAWTAKGRDKKTIALDVGYSPAVANSCVSKIENHRGFNNAMAKLAAESNNVALSIIYEFKSRGVEDFSNRDLISALSAIGNAWSRFNNGLRDSMLDAERDNGKNKLRTIVLNRIENQTVNNAPPMPEPKDVEFDDINMDF